MTTAYDPAECVRLCREAREETCPASCHDREQALADQLEAAGKEIERMSREGDVILTGTRVLIAERDQLRAEVEHLRNLNDRKPSVTQVRAAHGMPEPSKEERTENFEANLDRAARDKAGG